MPEPARFTENLVNGFCDTLMLPEPARFTENLVNGFCGIAHDAWTSVRGRHEAQDRATKVDHTLSSNAM